MRKLLLLGAVAALALTSCKDDKDGRPGELDKIYINGRDNFNKSLTAGGDGAQYDGISLAPEGAIGKKGQKRLTAKEICERDNLFLCTRYFDEEGRKHGCTTWMTIANGGIDVKNCRLVMDAGAVTVTGLENNYFLAPNHPWIIMTGVEKSLVDNMGREYNSINCTYPECDTVAYIPTANRIAAAEKLRLLADDMDGNWDEIFKIFTESFTFVPCTGREYLAIEKRERPY